MLHNVDAALHGSSAIVNYRNRVVAVSDQRGKTRKEVEIRGMGRGLGRGGVLASSAAGDLGRPIHYR